MAAILRAHHCARDSEFPGDQTIGLTVMRIRRQGLCRSAFRHREVPAAVLPSGSRESHTGTVLGQRLRPLARHGTYAIVIFAMTRPSNALPATMTRCWRPAIGCTTSHPREELGAREQTHMELVAHRYRGGAKHYEHEYATSSANSGDNCL